MSLFNPGLRAIRRRCKGIGVRWWKLSGRGRRGIRGGCAGENTGGTELGTAIVRHRGKALPCGSRLNEKGGRTRREGGRKAGDGALYPERFADANPRDFAGGGAGGSGNLKGGDLGTRMERAPLEEFPLRLGGRGQ